MSDSDQTAACSMTVSDVGITIKWDLGSGDDDALYVRLRRDITDTLKEVKVATCEPERRDITGVVEYIYPAPLLNEYTVYVRLDSSNVVRLTIDGEHWASALETPFADVRLTFSLYWLDPGAEPRVLGWRLAE
jgi:hypothetical protein